MLPPSPLPPTPHAPSPPLPQGLHGQLHTVWHHKLSQQEKAVLRSGAFPVLFIHGLKDKVAPAAYAQRLSRELGASIALLPGAHVVMRESAQQVMTWLWCVGFCGVGPRVVACGSTSLHTYYRLRQEPLTSAASLLNQLISAAQIIVQRRQTNKFAQCHNFHPTSAHYAAHCTCR